jgi:peptidoglycan/xylan/chitin deacetylase (PgdA/CDA1 family)
MPWKQDYTISDEGSLADAEIRWPEGARCCVAVTVDLSVASGAEGVTATDLATPEALFGANQGLAALREVLRERGMRATFAVPAVIAHIHCDLVRSLAAEGHEIAAHGFRHEDVSGLERDEERLRIARTTEILTDVAGRKPAGWFSLPRQGDRYAVGAISPNTIDLLLEAGYVYLGNGLADDIPHYWVSDFASRRALLTMPYYYHFDDQFFLMYPRKGTGLEHPDALLRNWRGEFAAQYKRGRYFHMTFPLDDETVIKPMRVAGRFAAHVLASVPKSPHSRSRRWLPFIITRTEAGIYSIHHYSAASGHVPATLVENHMGQISFSSIGWWSPPLTNPSFN